MSVPSINDKILNTLLSIFEMLQDEANDKIVTESLTSLISSIKSNTKAMNFIFQQIQSRLLNLQKEDKAQVIVMIPLLCRTYPRDLYPYLDKIISLYQLSISEDTTKIFPSISKSFGESAKILIMNPALNSVPSSSTLNSSKVNIKDSPLLPTDANSVFVSFRDFCMNNIKNPLRQNQHCGTLCLTAFIESCAYNYLRKENLKYIWEILIFNLSNAHYVTKLELLNCLISLIFSSEGRFRPFASMTLYKIIDYITDKDWLKRKLALNIVYTLIYYCSDEISTLRGYIIKFLNDVKNDPVVEVREVCIQILKMLGEEKEGSSSERTSYSGSRKSSQKKISSKNINKVNNKNSNSGKKKNAISIINQKNSNNNFRTIITSSSKNGKSFETIREQFESRARTPTVNEKSGATSERSSSALAKNSKYKNKILLNDKAIKANEIKERENKTKLNHSSENIRSNSLNKARNIRIKKNGVSSSMDYPRNGRIKTVLRSKPKLNIVKPSESKANSSTVKSNSNSESNTFLVSPNHQSETNSMSNAEALNQININANASLVDEVYNKVKTDMSIKVNRISQRLTAVEGEVEKTTKREKIKEELNTNLNMKNYENALKAAMELGSVNKIIFVMKNIQLNDDSGSCLISSETLGKCVKKICDNFLLCNNISLFNVFIRKRIIEKKVKFSGSVCRDISAALTKIISHKEQLGIPKVDIENLVYVVKYFNNE